MLGKKMNASHSGMTFSLSHAQIGFDLDDEYFLGPIVVFRNAHKQLEVIDGQQRLISLLLILRAFYEEMQTSSEGWSCEVRKNIGLRIMTK